MKACVIGAGSSGLAAVKALADAGVPFDCFEKSSVVGGLWVYDNPSGTSAAYKSLHINTSRDRMAYADFPMPRDWPDFLHHSLVARYLHDYAERFGLLQKITFRTEVTRAVPVGRQWDVTLSTGETRRYDALIVANGHHWDPRGPDPAPPGTFDGVQLHSHVYRDPTTPVDWTGKRVLIVGFGNSAMDLACELGDRRSAARVLLSVRTGGWVVPRYVIGRPLDTFVLPRWMPVRVRERIYRGVLRVAQGRPDRFGLPKPSFGVLSAHPTISTGILERLGAGDVIAKPGIRELRGDRVVFTDGTEEEVDGIVWCTGYRISFPFFDRTFLDPSGDNVIDLYLRVWPESDAPLAFVGLVQPLGAIMPIAELQSKLVADWLAGRWKLPDARARRKWIESTRRATGRRYHASKRHTIQVDFDDYLAELRAAWQRGR